MVAGLAAAAGHGSRPTLEPPAPVATTPTVAAARPKAPRPVRVHAAPRPKPPSPSKPPASPRPSPLASFCEREHAARVAYEAQRPANGSSASVYIAWLTLGAQRATELESR